MKIRLRKLNQTNFHFKTGLGPKVYLGVFHLSDPDLNLKTPCFVENVWVFIPYETASLECTRPELIDNLIF